MLAAYGTELGMNYETSLKVGSAFGGGMGKMGETCGVVTGALMIIGLKYGAKDVNDNVLKEKTFALSGEFIKRFEARNKSTICRKLIGFNIRSNNNPDKNKIILERCPAFVEDAAEIIEELL